MASSGETIGSAEVSKSWEDFTYEEAKKLQSRSEGIVRMLKFMDQLEGDPTVKAAFNEEFRDWRTSIIQSLSDMRSNSECAYLNLLGAEKRAETLQAELDALKKQQNSSGKKHEATKAVATENKNAKLEAFFTNKLKQRTVELQKNFDRKMSDHVKSQQQKLEDVQNKHAQEMNGIDRRYLSINRKFHWRLTETMGELETQKTFVGDAKKYIISLENNVADQSKQMKSLQLINSKNLRRLQVLNRTLIISGKQNNSNIGMIANLQKQKQLSAEKIATLEKKAVLSEKEIATLKAQAHAQGDQLIRFRSSEKEIATLKAQVLAQGYQLTKSQSLEKEIATLKQQAHAQGKKLIKFEALEKDRDILRHNIALRDRIILDRAGENGARHERENALKTQIADLVSENRDFKSRATFTTNQANWIERHKDHISLVEYVRKLNADIMRVKHEVKMPLQQGIQRIDQHKEGWVLSGKVEQALKKLFGENIDFVAAYFNRVHSSTGGLGERATTLQYQLPLRQGPEPAGNQLIPFKKSHIVDGASRAIPPVQKIDKQQATLNVNKTVAIRSSNPSDPRATPLNVNKTVATKSSNPGDPRAARATDHKQQQTAHGPIPPKRHASPKGAEDAKRSKVSGQYGSSSQQKKETKDKEICVADQRGGCKDKNCQKLHVNERFMEDA